MRYKSKYFKYEEFDSKDMPGSGVNISDELLKSLDYIREHIGKPVTINSGYRTPNWNKAVGGSIKSQHLLGTAADLPISSQEEGDKIQSLFTESAGEEVGIGRYNTFIHIDVRGKKARWDYRKKKTD